MPVLILILFIPVFWVLIIRPQQQQRRAHQETVASLAVGDRVMSVGGIIGTLTAVDDETVSLDTGDGHQLTLGRTFVRQRVDEDDRAEDEHAATPNAGDGDDQAPAGPIDEEDVA